MDTPLTRRGSLARLGGLALAAAARSLLGEAQRGNAAIETRAVQCVLTPELTRARTTSPARSCAATSATAIREPSSLFVYAC